ncbi:substrate-binding domain-containing protein [Mesorhizobium ventifaucium]|uniref:substrate-binding domain-containing protein n=1 Tax=Mesorhizobium ventifaucium TaxID=666020 RepID=UPI0020A79EA5|nr:substrate-binding domain-containing protein [Mesorhizobium ventifaucium]
MFVGVTGEAANIASARWLRAHHGDRIAVRGNNTHSVRELVAAGAGLSIFPCFVGDSDPRLVRVAQPIPELEPTNGSSPITRNVTRRRYEKSPTGLPP